MPTGAWAALAPRLGLIDANFHLAADVAVLSATVDDVRWALRYRLEHGSETVGTYLTEGLSNRVRERAEATRAALDGRMSLMSDRMSDFLQSL